MALQRIRALIEWLGRMMTQPQSELNRFQKTLRFVYDLGRHGARQLQHDRAPQMAGALAFRTLFALLPVLVLGTVLVRAFRGFEQMEKWLSRLFTQAGFDNFQVTGAANSEAPVAAGQSLSQWLLGLLDHVKDGDVVRMDGASGMAKIVSSKEKPSADEAQGS